MLHFKFWQKYSPVFRTIWHIVVYKLADWAVGMNSSGELCILEALTVEPDCLSKEGRKSERKGIC